jgi:hypothetical protein
MRKIGTAALVMTVAAIVTTSAHGQRYTHYPVCAVYGGWRGGGTESCAFMNFDQCRMSVSGRGGYCTANPFYQPPPPRRVVKRKRY